MISKNENFKRRVAEHYDRESIIYDKTRYVENLWYRRIDEEACKILEKMLRGPRVLELGSGTGKYGIFCIKKGFVWKGIDISKGMIEKAKENFKRERLDRFIEANVLGDVEDERFYPENYYDDVFCIKAFAFFPNPAKVVENVYKTLKPRGRFIIVTANNDSLYAKIKKPKSDMMNFYSFKDFEKLLGSHFKIIYKKRIMSFPGIIYRCFPRLAILFKKIDNALSIGTMSIVVAEVLK